MKRIAILVVFVAGAVLHLPADIAVAVGSREAALVVQDTRFQPGVQLLTELSVGVIHAWRLAEVHVVSVGGGATIGAVGSSAVRTGYLYRGLATRALWLAAGWTARDGLGLSLTGRAALGSYQMTTLLFFYPEVELAPTFRMRLGDVVRIDWAMPVFYQFRRDLAYAVGIGISARLGLEISPP